MNKTEQLTKSVEIQLWFLPSLGSLEMSLKRPPSHQASVPQVGSPQPMSSFHLCNWSVLKVASTCWLYKSTKLQIPHDDGPRLDYYIFHRLQAQKTLKNTFTKNWEAAKVPKRFRTLTRRKTAAGPFVSPERLTATAQNSLVWICFHSVLSIHKNIIDHYIIAFQCTRNTKN